MSNYTVKGEHYNPKHNLINLSTTQRPIHTDVRTVCSPEGYLTFGIDANKVDQCVANLMGALEGFKPDEMVCAVGIAFVLVVRRFQLHLPEYLGFIENFLDGDDDKLGCVAMFRFIHTCFREQLTRFQQVNFKNRQVKL